MSSHPNLQTLVSEADPPPIDSQEIKLDHGQVAVGAMVPGVQGQNRVGIEVLCEVNVSKQSEVKHFTERIGHQVRILAAAKHENVVEFRGWMMLDDEVLVHAAAVLTRCEGGEIMAFLREHRGVDRQGLVIGISQGVGHLHSKGVVHGNLSPRKIFVDCTYDIPIAKIGGFELCYSLRENPVYSGVEYGVLRLVRYAPPELLIRAGVECDTSGDVWSFACTSLEVLQERPPYITVQNDLQIPIAAVMHTSPYGWEDLDDFQRVLMDCLDYEPSRRPTVSRIADRLRLVMAGKHTLPIRLSIEHEIMQEDDRNLTGKIQSEKLHTHQGHPPFPYKGTHKGRPVCIQQSDYFNVTDSRVLAESIRVLKRQIRIWRQLMHPNIERLRGWMLSPESEVISLGLISAWHPHRDVMVYLRQHPVSNRRKMVYDIALGLCYLHSREIVHANIEPGNVVIGDGGNACLRGFQFSYDRLDKLLPSDYHPPSPRFGSPELLNGLTKVPDRENDVWAFGCVSVQILIGEPPYSHLTDNQIPVAAIPPYEWEGLDEFESSVARCFTYLPHRGRISINGVRDTLESCLAEETSEMSTGGRQGGRVYHSGFSASGEKNDSTLTTRTPDAQQLVRPEQSTGSGSFVDVDPTLHSERDVPQVETSTPSLSSTTRSVLFSNEWGFPPYPILNVAVRSQPGSPGDSRSWLNTAAQRFGFGYHWVVNELVGHNTVIWESELHVLGSIFRGQGTNIGYAKDEAAYKFFQAYPEYYPRQE